VQNQSSSDHICGPGTSPGQACSFFTHSLMLWHQAAQASVPALRAMQTQNFHIPLGQRSHIQIAPIAAAKPRTLSSGWLRLEPRFFVLLDKA